MRTLMSLTVIGTIVAGVATATAAPGGASSAEPVKAVAPAARASAPLNPAGEGRRAFLQFNCYGCHGMFAAGGMGPNIVHAESGDVSEAVKQGEEGGMPSFHNLVNSTTTKNLSTYLRSIGTPSEPTFMDWWVPVPTK